MSSTRKPGGLKLGLRMVARRSLIEMPECGPMQQGAHAQPVEIPVLSGLLRRPLPHRVFGLAPILSSQVGDTRYTTTRYIYNWIPVLNLPTPSTELQLIYIILPSIELPAFTGHPEMWISVHLGVLCGS